MTDGEDAVQRGLAASAVKYHCTFALGVFDE